MNRKEKELIKKILGGYYSQDDKQFSKEENSIIDRFIMTGILKEEAFHDRTTYADKGQRVFIKGVGYPLTLQGEKEYTKHWYLEFRNNIWIVFIRDFIGLVMLGISVWLTLSKILQSSQ